MTKVDECIKAEAGVGASIASGNHTWKANWAAFTPLAITRKKPVKFSRFIPNPNIYILKKRKKGNFKKIILKSVEFKESIRIKKTKKRKKSLNLENRKVLKAAFIV